MLKNIHWSFTQFIANHSQATMSWELFKLESHNIHDTISPLHITSKLYGLTCFSFKSNKRAFISFTDLFLMLLSCWIHFSLLVLYSTKIVFQAENDSLIARTGYPMVLSSSEYIALINILGAIFFRKNVAKILEDLDEVDEWVSNLKT